MRKIKRYGMECEDSCCGLWPYDGETNQVLYHSSDWVVVMSEDLSDLEDERNDLATALQKLELEHEQLKYEMRNLEKRQTTRT
jgi:chromosome segregation ATPase